MATHKLIINPIANKGGAAALIPDIEAELDKYQVDYDIDLTQYPWHAAEITSQAIAEGFSTVVAIGGDGTVNEVLNGIMLAQKAGHGTAKMGVIPIGRGNDFSFSMGVPQTLSESCAALAANETRTIDVGFLKGGLYPEGRYFGNGVGIGFDAMVGFLAHQGKLTGFMGYLVAAIKTIYLFFPAPVMEIVFDGETLTAPALMVSIMNGVRMGGGFMMAPKGISNDGLFDLTIARAVNRMETFKLIPRFIKGDQESHPAIHMKKSSKVVVRALEGTLPIHADGETICVECGEIEVEIMPNKIDLIVRHDLIPNK